MILATSLKDDPVGFSSENLNFGFCLLVLVQLLSGDQPTLQGTMARVKIESASLSKRKGGNFFSSFEEVKCTFFYTAS